MILFQRSRGGGGWKLEVGYFHNHLCEMEHGTRKREPHGTANNPRASTGPLEGPSRGAGEARHALRNKHFKQDLVHFILSARGCSSSSSSSCQHRSLLEDNVFHNEGKSSPRNTQELQASQLPATEDERAHQDYLT